MSAAEIRLLASLGLTCDQLAAVAEMLELRYPENPHRRDPKAIERTRRYRAKLDVSSSVWMELRKHVLLRDGFMCRYCGSNGSGRAMHCDHVVPVSKGGMSVLQNLVAACGFCNASKKAEDEQTWRAKRGL